MLRTFGKTQKVQNNRICIYLGFWAMLRIRIRWICKILASWIRIRKKCRSTGQNINKKLPNTKFTLKPQIWTFEKRQIIKMSWFLNGSSSLSIKISEKRLFENSALLKKFSKFYGNNLDPIFPVRIQDPDPHQN